MNNMEEIILEIYKAKQNYEIEFNKLMLNFMIKANTLVEVSEGLYQIETSIKLNKISLKDYILNSEICNNLKENNIINYSIEELKEIMDNYEQQCILNIAPYKLALDLYEHLEIMENLENEKIDYELKSVKKIIENIKYITEINKDKYHELYEEIMKKIQEKAASYLIDEKMNKYLIQIVNDIFNYYLYGNSKIMTVE